jgi:methylaspartate mutase sigma subunit
MESAGNSKGTLVTGVLGEDVHVIGIRVLEHALSAAGFRVVSLGIKTSEREFIEAAVEAA